MEYEHQYLIFGWQQDKMDAPLFLFLSFFLCLFLCFFVVCMYCTVLYVWVTVLHWGQLVIEPRASLTEQHKKWGKNNILALCPTLRYYYCRGWQVRVGVREREPSLMEEDEEEMKLHLFWWLTNDFEMRADLARRQNHFPNNTAWSLNKQN